MTHTETPQQRYRQPAGWPHKIATLTNDQIKTRSTTALQ
ncbi:hypothetical protein EDE11_12551 [Methylomonas methanica]|uniref:Uncharacterized protein n=1 Tax=Methylomonas methanica TaxID=421 RepID=A0ABY2CHK0_METMH|nr:hypothetical protein EDE11_12551 [Methylomonas methanica]